MEKKLEAIAEIENYYCSECKAHSMIEVGNIIECQTEGCKCWHYSSS